MQKKLIFLAIVVLLLSAVWYSSTNPSLSVTPLTLNAVTLKQPSDITTYTMNVKYPQVDGVTENRTESELNEAVKSVVLKIVESFKSSTSQNVDSVFGPEAKSELMIDYEVGRATSRVVSIQFKVLENYPGMAHPNNYNVVFNYDVSTQSNIALSQLFKPESNYLQTLSDMAKKDLLTQQKENPDASLFVDEGASPKEGNLQLFILSKDALVLLFNPATVAPDYFGTMNVSIPYEDFKDSLSPDFSFLL
ncbi:DUF3298 domain-containing protein [Candidatus Roizmanbacteria bacterium]|nr:DUF3298 domain-containing protein [Candidatus Roizmanbacteria bacterium]